MVSNSRRLTVGFGMHTNSIVQNHHTMSIILRYGTCGKSQGCVLDPYPVVRCRRKSHGRERHFETPPARIICKR